MLSWRTFAIFLLGCGLLCMKPTSVIARFNTSESQIHAAIFDGYDPALRPVFSSKDHIDMSVYIGINNIIEVDSKTQSLVTVGHVGLSWHDPRLVFNTTVPRPKHLVVPPSQIWSRTFSIMNSIDQQTFSPTPSDLAIIRENGDVLLFMYTKITSWCPVDVRKFPFDVQYCQHLLAIMCASYDKIVVRHAELLSQDYLISTDWVFRNASIDYSSVTDGAVTSQLVVVTLELARNPHFYLMSTVLPLLALSLLNPFVFALPVEHGERVSFSVALLLSYTVMLSSLSDVLPGSTKFVCYVGVLASMCVFISGCIAFLVILNAKISARVANVKKERAKRKLSMLPEDSLDLRQLSKTQNRRWSCREGNTESLNVPHFDRSLYPQPGVFLVRLQDFQTLQHRDQGVGSNAEPPHNVDPVPDSPKRDLAHRINKYAFIVTALATFLANATTFYMILT